MSRAYIKPIVQWGIAPYYLIALSGMRRDTVAVQDVRIETMVNYDLPYGYCRFDSLVGEVIEMGSYGCKVLLPNEDGSEHCPLTAFVRCDGRSIGQKMLVSLRYFSERYGNFVAALDSYIEAEGQEAAEACAVATLEPSAWPLVA